MRMIIGLTGPTGAGKSSTAEVAQSHGIKVIDCDKLARRAVEKGTEGLKQLTEKFGHDILKENGELDRKMLASKAFKDKESTELLNQTILPFIVKLVEQESDADKVMLDAPTLFESGIHTMCFKTIAVLADSEIRQKRIMARDHLTIEEAQLRMKAGKNEDFYKQNADYIIYNNGDEQEFKQSFDQLINNIFGGR